MSCCLKKYAKKTVVLTPQRPQGAITPLTPLTSELAKLELQIQKIQLIFLMENQQEHKKITQYERAEALSPGHRPGYNSNQQDAL